MANPHADYYYAGGHKQWLQRLPDSFAIRYKATLSPQRIERDLTARLSAETVEERKFMPRERLVLMTLPPGQTRSSRPTLANLDTDDDVELIAPVYRDVKSGLRLIATDEITVRFRQEASQAEITHLNQELGAEILEPNRFAPHQYRLQVADPEATLWVANQYQESPLTEFAEPNFVAEMKKASLPNDEWLAEQWHLRNTGQGAGAVGEDVDAAGAWAFTIGAPDITVAIIDDGVDIDHPDLHANIWKNPDPQAPDVYGWNFFDDNDNPRPQKFSPPYDRLLGNDSHGTPCAGVVAAVGNNAVGVVGIAHGCKILPVKIFLADDLVPFHVVADAIRYAGTRADVLSNSWGTAESSNIAQAIQDVVQTGRNGKGCPVFVATGNDGLGEIGFPAAVSEAIAVGASTNQGRRADYSNYGRGLDFVAPSNGGTRGIFTADVSIPGRGFNVGAINQGDADGLYTNSFGGTSSATPLAAGIAALILSLNPALTWEEVRTYLRETADKIDTVHGSYRQGYSRQYGFGRLNARRALEAVQRDLEGPEPGRVIEKSVAPHLAIPDHDRQGVLSTIAIEEDGTVATIEGVSVAITHSYRSDLWVSLLSPNQTEIKLHEGQGGSANDLVETYTPSQIPAFQQLTGEGIRGTWSLQVADHWAQDTGTLNQWSLKLKVAGQSIRGVATPGLRIPDNDPTGIVSQIGLSHGGQVKAIAVKVAISHTYIQDLTVQLIAPSGKAILLHNRTGGSQDNIEQVYTPTTHLLLANFIGEVIAGNWQLVVADHAGADIGKLNQWELEIQPT
jgi:subtilisin-like proprotein convertase family protein/subtilisin family serine protease